MAWCSVRPQAPDQVGLGITDDTEEGTECLTDLSTGNGSVLPENIRFITTASDKLVILTDQGVTGHGLRL